MLQKTQRLTSTPENNLASSDTMSRAMAITRRVIENIKQASGVEFTRPQQDAIEEVLSSEFALFTEIISPELLEDLESYAMAILEIREWVNFPQFREDLKMVRDFARDSDKWRAAHARSGRSKSLRERTIAQGIAENTKGWNGKHHFKKAEEIHGAINALLKNAGLKTARGTPQTISVEALSRRLKALSEKIGSARSD
jgi:hypothetical protein